MTLWKLKIRKESLAGFQERLNRFWVERSVVPDKLSFECLRFLVRFRIIHQTQLFENFVVRFLGNLIEDVTHLMHPAPLMPALVIDLPKSLPETSHAIADQKADPFDPSPFKTAQEVFP